MVGGGYFTRVLGSGGERVLIHFALKFFIWLDIHMQEGSEKPTDLEDYMTKDQFPDLNLPENLSRKEKKKFFDQLQQMLSCLLYDKGWDKFRDSVVGVFGEMGILESQDSSDVEWNNENFQRAYGLWQQRIAAREGGAFYIDAEMRTRDRGYVNLYIRYFFNEERIIVFPGACSSGNMRPNEHTHLPVLGFDSLFSQLVPHDHNWLEKGELVAPDIEVKTNILDRVLSRFDS